MAKVPLRLYNREIENLIDRKQTEEATAHCRHILQIFPKHIDTYRLLGKAHLESHHYSEASDIFQRVISVIPDDFVSHIGLSIIREDEGNLDASIWHMERAFEVAPANSAVQEELRRRYTRRDGVEPPKVRLTRAALVRMYANGFLYDQAITEINNALAEEPDRADLQVMLARMFLANGQKIEATEVCSRLLEKYPYCWAANQILSEILSGSARPEETQVYQQRLVAMDPYAAYLSPIYSTPAEVPDNLVQVDRLEWDTSAGYTAEKPGWADSLGLKIDESLPLDIPDWLNPNPHVKNKGAKVSTPPADVPRAGKSLDDVNSGPAAVSQSHDISEKYTEPPASSIPEWMRDAGWFSGVEDKPGSGSNSPEDTLAAAASDVSDVIPADIPDWVRSMAPTDDRDTQAPQYPAPVTPQPVKDASLPDWLSNMIDRPEETPAASSELAHAEVPDWLKNLEPGVPSAVSEIPEISNELTLEEEKPVTPEPVEADLSGWLKDVEETVSDQPHDQVEEIPPEVILPDLQQVPEKVEFESIPVLEETPKVEGIALPSWLDSYEEEPLEDQPAPVIPAWLDGIQVEGIETEDEMTGSQPASWFDEAAAASDLASQVQSWEDVKPGFGQSVQQEELESAVMMPEAVSGEAEETSSVELPDVEPGSPFFEQEPEADAVVNEQLGEEGLPDWLRSFEGIQADAVKIQAVDSISAEEQLVAAEPEFAEAVDEGGEKLASFSATEEDKPAEPDKEAKAPGDDTTIAWLEDLATTHSSEAKTLIIRKGNRNIQPPEWVREDTNVSEPVAKDATQPFPSETAGFTQSENAALENWLKELESEQQLKSPDAFVNKREPVPKNTAALRMWLDNLLEESPEETPAVQIPEDVPAGQVGIDQVGWVSEPEQEIEETSAASLVETSAEEKIPEVSEILGDIPFSIETESTSAGIRDSDSTEQPVGATSPDLPIEEPAQVQETSFEPESGLIDNEDEPVGEVVDLPVPEPENLVLVEEGEVKSQAVEAVSEIETIEQKEIAGDLTIAETESVVEAPVDQEITNVEPIVAESSTEIIAEVEPESDLISGPESDDGAVDQLAETPVEAIEITSAASEVEIPEPITSDEQMIVDEIEPSISLEETLLVELTPVEVLPEQEQLEPAAADEQTIMEVPVSVEALPDQTEAEVEIPDWLRNIVEEEKARAAGIEAPVAPDTVEVFQVTSEEIPEPLYEIPEASLEVETSSESQIPSGTGLQSQEQDWSLLQLAEKNLWGGEVETSLNQYARLIKTEHHLEETIRDLKDALYQRPLDVGIWETLGDAYARNNCLQDALDAYTKAEELLR